MNSEVPKKFLGYPGQDEMIMVVDPVQRKLSYLRRSDGKYVYVESSISFYEMDDENVSIGMATFSWGNLKLRLRIFKSGVLPVIRISLIGDYKNDNEMTELHVETWLPKLFSETKTEELAKENRIVWQTDLSQKGYLRVKMPKDKELTIFTHKMEKVAPETLASSQP